MRDIVAKQISLRTAKGIGVIICQPETIELIKTDSLPKGDLFHTARAAGFLAAKNTHNLIPLCHPVGIEAFKIKFEYLEPSNPIEGLEYYTGKHGVVIVAEGKSIGRTGIEIEVLTSISITALTIYDLLKPVDKTIEITNIKLLDKKGGKSDREQFYKGNDLTAAVLVCSDAIHAELIEDEAGILAQEKLQKFGVVIADYKIVPDSIELIQHWVKTWVEQGIDFIFTTGGAGLTTKDVTIEAIQELLEKEIPAITETMRTHRGMRSPYTSTSRGIAGTVGQSTIITLPGNMEGVSNSLDGILPAVFHSKKLL